MAEGELRKGRLKRGYGWLWLIAVLFASIFYLYYVYPGAQIGPKQPVSFSHRIHAGMKQINCRFCHPDVDRSWNAGLPPIEKCFFCHKYIIPEHTEIRKEKTFYDAKKPVPWVRIFWIPDFVFFNHTPHTRWADFDCSRCHGDVKTMDRLQYKDFKMNFCITCHRQNKAQVDCWLACHR